jgi:hypothetical protein
MRRTSGGRRWAAVLVVVTVAAVAVSAEAQAVPDCLDGVVKDDGTVETGYGWVPSAIWGVYVQEFQATEFTSPFLDAVCVCWLRTSADDTIDFDLVIYGDAGGVPEMTPHAVIPATASEVPDGVAAAGEFWEVDVTGVTIGPGTWYIGARWNPSVDQYFFVCTDKSPETEPVNVFYLDDRADEWGSALDTGDPTFDDHRAIMVRPRAQPQPPHPAVPALGPWGLALLTGLLLAAGVLLLRSRA